jgi:hypothetical protein
MPPLETDVVRVLHDRRWRMLAAVFVLSTLWSPGPCGNHINLFSEEGMHYVRTSYLT